MCENPTKFSRRRSCCPECRVPYKNLNRQVETIDVCGHLKCQHCAETHLLKCSQCEKEKKRQYVLDSSPNHPGHKLTYRDFEQGSKATLINDTEHNSVQAGVSLTASTKPECSKPAKEVRKEGKSPAPKSARKWNEGPKIGPSSRTRNIIARAKRQLRKPIEKAIPPQKKRNKFRCDPCNMNFSKKETFVRHQKTKWHIKKLRIESGN